MGAPTDRDHAGNPVSNKTENRRAYGAARSLDRYCVWILAVGGNAGLRGYRRAWRFVVLWDFGGLPSAVDAG